MFQWLNLKEFMNDYREWHAFCEGFAEVFVFWKERHRLQDELLEDLLSEHHYYTFGRCVGFVCLVLFGVGIIKLTRSIMETKRTI